MSSRAASPSTISVFTIRTDSSWTDSSLESLQPVAGPDITMDEAITHQPGGKKAKLSIPIVCDSCWDAITGPYSTPCLKCRKPWCRECVKEWFTMAIEDSDSMPARCCGIVMHHGVAGGILLDADYEAYKLRYDERTTSNPLYCPVSTCSTFIPPRLMNYNTGPMQGTISCIKCFTPICMECMKCFEQVYLHGLKVACRSRRIAWPGIARSVVLWFVRDVRRRRRRLCRSR